ncbi:MAG: VWA domain-containing protein [Candidatus Binatia bacterium]
MSLTDPRRAQYPLGQDLGRALLGRILGFCRLLRRSDLGVTPSRIVDAIRSLEHVRLDRRHEFHIALRANLASSPEEERTFDRLFHRYWEGGDEAPRQYRTSVTQSESANPGHLSRVTGSGRRYSPLEVLRGEEEAFSTPAEWIVLERTIRRLAPKIATRPSRRRRPARRGRAIDLRRSFRRSLPSGMELVALARTSRKVRKLRLLVLCDVSGSMDCHGELILGSLLALQRAVPGSRTFVFSTRVTEVTDVLKKRSIPEALAEMRTRARHWSGGTDLGAALTFVNRYATAGAWSRRTVGVILSDGYDQGDPDPIGREMATLRRRTRRLLWVNPLVGTEGYEPIASGMRAALPHVDDFLAAGDVESLSELFRKLRYA